MTTHAGAGKTALSNNYGDLAAALMDELVARLGGQAPQPRLAAVESLEAPAKAQRKRRPKLGAYKYLRPEEATAIRKAINTGSITGLRNRCIFELWYRAGLRVGEVCALAPRHVDIDEGEIAIFDGKGGKDRVAYFDKAVTGPLLEAWLRERKALGLASSPTLFCTIRDSHTTRGGYSPKGRPVTPRYLQGWLKRMCRKAGLDEQRTREITPHKLRHTWATEYYREKRDIIQIKEQLGHERLETTMVYTHIVDGDRKASIQERVDPLTEEVGSDGQPAARTDARTGSPRDPAFRRI
jgi:site-specific recombinase XerD